MGTANRGFVLRPGEGRAVDLGAVVRSAASADPALAELPGQIHEMRFQRQDLILRTLTDGEPSPIEGAADTFSALASPEVHHILVAFRNWPQERYAAWLRRTVVATLFED